MKRVFPRKSSGTRKSEERNEAKSFGFYLVFSSFCAEYYGKMCGAEYEDDETPKKPMEGKN